MKKITLKKLIAYAIVYTMSSLLLWSLMSEKLEEIWIAFVAVAVCIVSCAAIVWASIQINE